MSIRLAIVDGHTLTRYGLRELVAQHPDIEVVAECGSAAKAVRVLAAAAPDVVTVDVTLPDGDGLQLAGELRDHRADLGIVMLTSHGEDDLLFRALETGVSAFVPKTAPVDEVLGAIRHAAVAAASFTATGLAAALARRRTMQDRLALSKREGEVLALLRDGLSIPAISLEMYISQSTAKTYVARLYEKLGAANRAQALMTAMHYGLIRYEQAGGNAPQRASTGGSPGSATARRASADSSPGSAAARRASAGGSSVSPAPGRVAARSQAWHAPERQAAVAAARAS